MTPVDNNLQSTIDQLGLGKAVESTKKDPMGQDAFLRLMITQMKNQNPLEPLKNQEFLAQLSQFTTASGVQGLQKSFDSLSTALQSNQALQASSLVGRSVLVDSDRGYLPPGGLMKGNVELPNAVGNMTLTITNQVGEIVKTIQLGQRDAGEVRYAWDGTDDKGARAPNGIYNVTAQASFNGQSYTFATAAETAVESVTIGRNGQGMVLNIGALGAVDLSQIKQIY